MYLKVLILSLVAVLSSQSVMAYQSCDNYKIGHVFSDGQHAYIGTTPDALDGVITNTKTSYETMVSIALAARASGNEIRVRYKDDAVDCSNPTWNAEIIGIGF